jgi:RNA polymerase sigma-70 factor (ECF subfamily)
VDRDASDAELLRAWQDGDPKAGNHLVRRHFEALFRFFRSRVDEGVADLVQQTFLGCAESRDRLSDGADFRPYLFGIARNKLLMHMRGQRRRGRVIAEGASSPEPAGPTLSRLIGGREEQRLLLRALRRLPVDLQLALVLSYWEGLTMQQIGDVFGIPAGTAKSRLHHARELLKKEIVDLAPSSDTAEVTVVDLERWARGLRDELGREEE